MKSWLKGMSFSSRAWSSGTLLRGLDLLEQGSSAAMSSMVDPDPRALMEELARLEVPWPNQPTVCSFRFGERLKSYDWLYVKHVLMYLLLTVVLFLRCGPASKTNGKIFEVMLKEQIMALMLYTIYSSIINTA